LELNFLRPINKEREAEAEFKKHLDERKKIYHDYETLKKTGG
jgi:hypothetical protein